MSRQPVRQLPPADDDLTAMAEEEQKKRVEAVPGSTMEPPNTSQARPIARSPVALHGSETHTAERDHYFGGRYSPFAADLGPMSPETVADQKISKFGLPTTLRHCIAGLIQILRDYGLGVALAAAAKDPSIDKKYQDAVGRLLAMVDRDERGPRA